MTAPTPKQVRQRIMDIAAQSALVVTVSNGLECQLTAAQLPALVVAVDGTTDRSYTSRESRLITREYRLLLLVAQICSDQEADQLAALEQVWDVIDALPDYFARHAKRLDLVTNGLPVALTSVQDTGHMRDDAPQFTSWGGQVYACALYHLPVITQRA